MLDRRINNFTYINIALDLYMYSLEIKYYLLEIKNYKITNRQLKVRFVSYFSFFHLFSSSKYLHDLILQHLPHFCIYFEA